MDHENGDPGSTGTVQRLFEHVGDMACLLDAQGRFTWVNGAATRLTGYTADELAGRPAAELIAPEVR